MLRKLVCLNGSVLPCRQSGNGAEMWKTTQVPRDCVLRSLSRSQLPLHLAGLRRPNRHTCKQRQRLPLQSIMRQM